MLDYFCIFARSGLLLWAIPFVDLKGDPINSLIKECLLEERAGQKTYEYTPPSGSPYTLKWLMHNGLGLVFVAVYQKVRILTYVEKLLETIRDLFEKDYRTEVFEYKDFDKKFYKALEECEANGNNIRMKVFGKHINRSNMNHSNQQKYSDNDDDSSGDGNDDDDDDNADDDADSDINREECKGSKKQKDYSFKIDSMGNERIENEFVLNESRLASLTARGINSKKPKSKSHLKKHNEMINIKKNSNIKKSKADRKWDTTPDVKKIDFSNESNGNNKEIEKVDLNETSKMHDIEESDEEYIEEDLEFKKNPENVNNDKEKPKSNSLISMFWRNISLNVIGSESLGREDIESALNTLKIKLMEKNVAQEIATQLCESVSANLEGQRLKSFTSISTVIKNAFEEALTRILTPNKTINILAEIEKAKSIYKPYIIVFVGVNGVGKSTNLAKVAYWLLQNQKKVMIAACDTFRSGAVEQLRTHCTRLQIPLFERGYEKDPAKVAFEASKKAELELCDVLLVDTAGRMQDNEPLMRALANLIDLNKPDLVLFVGEALVGNDAVDQLTKFNQRLTELSSINKKKSIDGILLTKFDTIDDKVGAAISMVYSSGSPIMFVGCGQTYIDLKRLNVKSVVKSLLK